MTESLKSKRLTPLTNFWLAVRGSETDAHTAAMLLSRIAIRITTSRPRVLISASLSIKHDLCGKIEYIVILLCAPQLENTLLQMVAGLPLPLLKICE